ncbi:MAG TPA: porin family protein [Vicinamibacterales bacterium]|nr:porin family protein [Vicinamibacterales bacterium]
MGIRVLAAAVLCGALVIGAPATASADWMFTPFVGLTAGGNVEDISGASLDTDTKANFGGGLTWMGAGIVGFDLDFGYAPNFFGDSPEFGDSNVTTLMANAVVGVPIGGQSGAGVRPYVVGGIGLLRERIDSANQFFDDVSRNDWGFNLGGGVTGFVTDNVGIRGDIRYFRALKGDTEDDRGTDLDIFDIDSLDFWRATVGVSFRFGG